MDIRASLAGRAAAVGEASGYGYPGERERATLRAARALARRQFELRSSAARRGPSRLAEATCPSAGCPSAGWLVVSEALRISPMTAHGQGQAGPPQGEPPVD